MAEFDVSLLRNTKYIQEECWKGSLHVERFCAQAADEIDRLRSELDRATRTTRAEEAEAERDRLRSRCEELEAANKGLHEAFSNEMFDMTADRDLLKAKAERYEGALREICDKAMEAGTEAKELRTIARAALSPERDA